MHQPRVLGRPTTYSLNPKERELLVSRGLIPHRKSASVPWSWNPPFTLVRVMFREWIGANSGPRVAVGRSTKISSTVRVALKFLGPVPAPAKLGRYTPGHVPRGIITIGISEITGRGPG